MKRLIVRHLGLIWVGSFTCLAAPDNLTDAEFKGKILYEGDSVTSDNALNLALKKDRPDLLLFGVDAPSDQIKASAVVAIGKLPKKEAIPALISVLERDYWTGQHRFFGGRAKIIQDNYVASVQAALANSTHLNVNLFDPFDERQRNEMLSKLKAMASK